MTSHYLSYVVCETNGDAINDVSTSSRSKDTISFLNAQTLCVETRLWRVSHNAPVGAPLYTHVAENGN